MKFVMLASELAKWVNTLWSQSFQVGLRNFCHTDWVSFHHGLLLLWIERTFFLSREKAVCKLVEREDIVVNVNQAFLDLGYCTEKLQVLA